MFTVDPILDLYKQKICKTVEEIVDLAYKLPQTMFLEEMSITLLLNKMQLILHPCKIILFKSKVMDISSKNIVCGHGHFVGL